MNMRLQLFCLATSDPSTTDLIWSLGSALSFTDFPVAPEALS